MTDYPKLLRAIAGGTQAQENKHDLILNGAADEIERLTAALRGLLDEVMCLVVDPPSAALNHAIEEAGRALEPKP